jgi:solute carrier family 13 (sodium-dependent dicarboxylate transporter), member 2/3/5
MSRTSLDLSGAHLSLEPPLEAPPEHDARWTPWRLFFLVCGPLVAAAIALLPSGLHEITGAGSRPAYAAAVSAMMAVWWLGEAFPIAWTACLPLVLFPLLGVFGRGALGDAQQVLGAYVDAYIFLFLGGMAIGAAMEQWSLHRRVALHIMRAVGTEPSRLLLGLLLATASVSLWISNTATAVMMLPIAMALVAQLEAAHGGRRLAHFGCALALAVAYGSNIGGIGTKIGTGTNSIFCGFLAEQLGIDIGFLPYMGMAFPFVVLFLPLSWVVLWRVARRDVIDGVGARETLERELAAMGAMSQGEKRVAAVFIAAAMLWIGGDLIRPAIAAWLPLPWDGFRFQVKHYEASVAMLAASTLLLTNTLSLSRLRGMPWAAIVLLGGSFAMASGIEGSGLSSWLAAQLTAVTSLPLVVQLALTSVASVGLSALASNTATVNILLNVLPRSFSVLATTAIASSCDFMLPAGTPPNAIVFGSGYVRLPTMMRVGFVLDIAAVVGVALYAFLWIEPWFG